VAARLATVGILFASSGVLSLAKFDPAAFLRSGKAAVELEAF